MKYVLVCVSAVAVFTAGYFFGRHRGALPPLAAPSAIFRIGFIPSERAQDLSPKAQALAAFLERELAMPVETIIPTSYEPLLEGLRFGHLDASYMDAGPAWLASQRTGAAVVLAETNQGSPYYYGELFTRADSPLRTLEDMAGTRIAFTSWTGSSGFILPVGNLIEAGLIKPDTDDFADLERALRNTFSEYTISGGYTQSLQLLLDGRVDVAGGAHDAPERFLDESVRHKVRSALRLGKVPSHPLVVASHVPHDLRTRFIAAMMKLNEDPYRHILTDLYGVDGLIETSTEEHLGEFGPVFAAVTGIHERYFPQK